MASVTSTHPAAPQMTHTPDPAAIPQAQAAASVAGAGLARPRLRDQIAENPLLSLLGGLLVALLTFMGTAVVATLVFALTGINDRINDIHERIDDVHGRINDTHERIDDVDDRIDRLEVSLSDRIDRLETKMDAGFVAQGTMIADLDRKLTALIAMLPPRVWSLLQQAPESADGRLPAEL